MSDDGTPRTAAKPVDRGGVMVVVAHDHAPDGGTPHPHPDCPGCLTEQAIRILRDRDQRLWPTLARALVTPDPAPEVERLRTALGPFAYHAFDEHDECRWCGVEIEWDHEPACPVPGAIVALSEVDHAD